MIKSAFISLYWKQMFSPNELTRSSKAGNKQRRVLLNILKLLCWMCHCRVVLWMVKYLVCLFVLVNLFIERRNQREYVYMKIQCFATPTRPDSPYITKQEAIRDYFWNKTRKQKLAIRDRPSKYFQPALYPSQDTRNRMFSFN